ncbi:MAG: hypothetical protein JO025_00895 [Verrucomicrobia bacterium]|nr:hypothetical protein [Verrucomicrobiota bacterium]
MKYSNTIYTVALSIVFFVPFAVAFVAPTLEPYPALLLPSGAGTIKTTEDQMDFTRTSIFGKRAVGDSWTRLSPSQFLSPIPPEFFPSLAQRYFALRPVAPVPYRTRVGVVIKVNPRKVDEKDIPRAKEWLRTRLKETGCEDSLLRISQEVVTIRRSDGAELGVRNEDDSIFELR